ncbi:MULTISPECIES: hypothetical protein [unclassified Streptomyces]|uniref:hypothetical protein n=1 Tax=unclassified Streptomyces TaxID=2593676 RepID=UPI002365309F|nr:MULTISPECIES: hypothetical protein [unclassified Streptomyces]MDF3146765.1 hypothetical protein [Streptomyces sp. T21Q-yed]WDF37621.1 hypothetical protein PBV52_12810 [Streptomyces sp. T12]
MDGWVALLLCVVVGGFLVWYAHYPFLPSKWRYGCPDSRHRPERQALAKARRARRTGRDTAARIVAEAERGFADGIEPFQRRVQELSRAREELPRQGSGQEVKPELWLWPLGLLEHELLFLKEEAAEGQGEPRKAVDERLPLAGVTVKLDCSQDHVYIRVARPDGTRRSQPYPRHQEIAADALVEAIHNQVVKHEEFSRDLQRRDADLVAEIRRAEADLAKAEEAGRPALDGAKERARTVRARADAGLRTARDTWRTDGGGVRPPW